jgi:hypothetical protein
MDTMIKTAALRIYSHLAQQSINMPARQLLEDIKAMTISDVSKVSQISTTKRFRDILIALNQKHNWDTINIDIIPGEQPRHQIKPKTSRRRWIHHISAKLAKEDYNQLCTWVKNQPQHNNIQPQLSATGRPQQYMRNTQRDHEYRLHNQSLAKSPYQPFQYIKLMTDARLVSNLIRIRSQNSYIPSHIPSTRQGTTYDKRKYKRINYAERFCPACIPLRTTWGNAAPGIGAAIGSEEHLLLHCTHTQDHKIQTFININNAVASIVPTTPTLTEPWYDLSDTEKLQTIMGCTPPTVWTLKKKDEELWFQLAEPHIQTQVTELLRLGTIYKQDINKYYA